MTDFVSAVAERVGRPIEEVREVLAASGIVAYAPRGLGERVRLNRLWFSGVKNPETGDLPFEFEWRLVDGVQAVAGRNSAGKTSVIEICRWMLTGRDRHAVGGLDPRVRAMLRSVRLELTIGTDAAVIELDASHPQAPGSLTIRRQSVPFNSVTMEDVVGALMLDRLRLRSTAQFQRGSGSVRGSVTEHGWPLLSGALIVGPTHLNSVVGTVPNEAGRVLQVYMGLPWYETFTQARAKHAQAKQAAADRLRAAKAEDDARGKQTEQLRQELAKAQAELASLGSEVDLVRQIRVAVRKAGEVGVAVATAEQRLAEANAELERVVAVHTQARRELAAAREHQRASVFFRALQPSSCPRCASPITKERLEAESQQHTCSVCTSEHSPEGDEQAIVEAEAAVAGAAEILTTATALRDRWKSALAEQKELHEGARGDIERLSLQRDTGQRQAKLMQIERFRGRLQEREDVAKVVSVAVSDVSEIEILEACTKEAEARMKEHDDLLEALNARLLDLGCRFGVSELTEVKLDRAAHLPVRKGATQYSFTRLSEGDRLRLKVAVVIALLQLAGERGLGHHPGLLFVDSPGAQEVGSEPLSEMLAALRELATQQQIQVLVATARRDEAVSCLGIDRVRVPRDQGGALW